MYNNKTKLPGDLDWSIVRNALYIEPDVEYLEHYKKDGKIRNGEFNIESDYEVAAWRKHIGWDEYFPHIEMK